MTSHRNPDAHGKALESGENSRANGSRHDNLNAPEILRDSPPSREGRGRQSHDPAASPEASTPSRASNPVHDDKGFRLNLLSATDEAALAVCFDKNGLARFLQISIRSIDRARALGLLPAPDLTVSNRPRWSPSTIQRWLRTKPRLPGRGGHHGR